MITLRTTTWLCALLSLAVVLVGEAANEDDKGEANKTTALPADARAESNHRLPAAVCSLPYRATASSLTVADEEGRPSARIFNIAYVAAQAPDGSHDRPLTFVFNGGPGAASAYLHLGALGPKRLVLDADGSVPPPPVRLTDNTETWLPLTDLVFVDPPGTGYSRILPGDGDDTESQKKDTSVWGVEEDVKILARFIGQYLTENGRWASPVYLAGESYGGYRVALLAERLYEQEGVATAGLAMISPVLDFSLIWGGEQVLLRWAALLPTFAAVASEHGRGPRLELDAADPRAALAEIEAYALGGLLTGLAKGGKDPELLSRFADYSGLAIEEISRHRARVPASRFAKLLLADRRRLVALYDGSLTQIDPEPDDNHTHGGLYLDQLGAALMAAFHVQVDETLGFKTALDYRLLERKIAKAWNWDSGIAGSQGFGEGLSALERALSLNPSMRTLVVHGVHDLVTTYYASAIALQQLDLEESLAANLRLAVYPGGHMFYARQISRESLYEDARWIYRADRAGCGDPARAATADGGETAARP